jgi:hypothetical protein
MRSTPEQKQAALTLARTGKYYCAEIARTIGIRPQLVRDICDRNGVILPLGYSVWLKAKRRQELTTFGLRD